jgi:hypothetical protein
MSIEEKKLPEGFKADDRVVAAMNTRLNDGQLACTDAFAVAENLGVAPITVGRTADVRKVKLTRCQLGLFGYPGKQGWDAAGAPELPEPEGLESAIRAAKNNRGQLPCAKAWQIASNFRVPRMQVGYIADRLGIKITPCQLGAF